MLEYAVSVAAVAVGWGEYLNDFLPSLFGWQLPPRSPTPPASDGGVVNIPAIVIVLLAGWLLLRGASESATANAVFVLIKIGVLAVLLRDGVHRVRPAGNLTPFAPLGIAASGRGVAGVLLLHRFRRRVDRRRGGQEPAARPPRGDHPVARHRHDHLRRRGARGPRRAVRRGRTLEGKEATCGARAAATRSWRRSPRTRPAPSGRGLIISFGAVISIVSVVLTVMYGQTRILFAMARDGLLPRIFRG